MALVVVMGLVVAACGNSGDDGDAGDAGGASADTGAEADEGGASPSGDVPGVTDSEIRFSVFGTRSNNPTGACILDCYIDGINAYFAFRNSEGGAFGRDLVLTTELDDELARNQERALEIVSADDTFAAFSATQVANGWSTIAEAGMPLYVWGIHPVEMNGHESIFANNGVICPNCSARTYPYAGSRVDATRVATLGYGVSQTSKDCVEAQSRSLEEYGGELGQELAYANDELAFGLPNGIGPEVTAMKDAGVDFISTCLDLNGMRTLAQELERQGMGDVPMLHPNSYDQAFVADAGELFEGDLVGVGFRPFEADPGDSALGDYLDWMEETGSELSETSMVGWINADLAYQGILAAGEGFDRASVIAATNEMTEYTADGLINAIDWARQHDFPTDEDPTAHGYARECMILVEVSGGEMQLVGEQDAPWWCWDNSTSEWSEPEPTDFE